MRVAGRRCDVDDLASVPDEADLPDVDGNGKRFERPLSSLLPSTSFLPGILSDFEAACMPGW